MKKLLLIFCLSACQFCVQAQNWLPVGGNITNGGLNSFFLDTATNELYATGTSIEIDSVMNNSNGILKWNGTNWEHAFAPTGVTSVKQLIKFQGELYVSGTAGGCLFKWNGNGWDTIGVVTGGGCVGLYNDGDSVLYVMGDFNTFNSIPANKVVKYDGSVWSALDTIQWAGGAFGSAIRYNGKMYFSGAFYHAALGINSLVSWDGQSWQKLGTAIIGGFSWARCFYIWNGYLYVGGYYDLSLGNPGNNIARWDGTSWSQVGGGVLPGQVVGLKEYNGALWAIGGFLQAGNISATYIAKFDGTDWCSVGVFSTPPSVIEIYNGELIIGGAWHMNIDGDSVGATAKWVGGNFTGACGNATAVTEQNASVVTVSVYPNPATESAVFTFNGLSSKGILSLYDQFGCIVWQSVITSSNIELVTSGFASGIYCYRLDENGEIKATGKLVIGGKL